MSALCATTHTQINEEALEEVLRCLTPTNEEVATWHFIDITLRVDRQRPLVQLLAWLVEGPRRSPIVIPGDWIDLSTTDETNSEASGAARAVLHSAA